MATVSYITDENNQKKAVVINLKDIQEHSEEIHDLIDVLIAESRKGEETISLEDLKAELKSKGKL